MNPTRRAAVQLSLLAAFLPSFLSSAWAATDRRATLFDAHRRAVEVGRPLLVLVVPAERERWDVWGRAFGALLNHGGDEALAAFALCEVVAADGAALAELVGQPVPADARYALVETDRVPAAVRFARVGADAVSTSRDWSEDVDAPVEAMIRVHRDALVALVLPDRSAVARYAAQAAGAAPRGEVAERATLALAAADGKTDRAHAASVLAESGRTAWVQHVVPGSRWAMAGGCGVEVEGATDNLSMDCGLGHVSAKAARMLWFYEGATG